MKFKIFLSVLWASLLAGAVPALPWSYPGSGIAATGEPVPGDGIYHMDARTLSLGGASAASAHGPYAVFYNPAGLGLVPRRALAVSAGLGFAGERVPDERKYSSSHFFRAGPVSVIYPAGRFFLGVGYARRRDMGYEYDYKSFTQGKADTFRVESSGGINGITLACGLGVLRDLYAGVTVDLLTGSASGERSTVIYRSSRDIYEGERDFSGTSFSLGAVYSLMEERLIAAAVWNPGYTLRDEWSLERSEYLWGANNWTESSSSEPEGQRDLSMPSGFTLSAQYNFPGLDRTMLTADVSRRNWSSFRYREKKDTSDPAYGERIDPSYRDVTAFRAGLEHYIDFTTALRAGFAYEPFYGDTGVDLVKFTAGVGVELSRSFFLDIGLGYGMRTYYGDNPFSDDEQRVSENIMRIMCSTEWHF